MSGSLLDLRGLIFGRNDTRNVCTVWHSLGMKHFWSVVPSHRIITNRLMYKFDKKGSLMKGQVYHIP
jgi:hypothetical protein